MVYSNNLGQSRVGIRNLVVNVVNSVDADAIAFITAAGITNLTQAAAINTLVNDLKTYGLWTKMKALYPMVGGSATSHKFNLKDPRDVDAAYRLTFNGGWTHSSTGALPNGTTGYADTKFIMNQVYASSVTNIHVSYYSRSNTNKYPMVGLQDDNVGNGSQMYIADNGTTQYYSALNTDANSISINSSSQTIGYYLTSRTSLSSLKGYKNGIVVGSNTTTSTSANLKAQIPIYIGASNFRYNTQTISYGNKESAFASIGDGLTDAESTALYNTIQKFQTTLGRQIGSPIVSDTDAQAFINAAGLTDLGQANAVNTLVVDLKAAGVWTKMKALYPMVGGSATSHKFNLKDPRDLDAAFRLSFSGGWTHSSTGALPNGTNGYANTRLAPQYVLASNNSHLSFYSRSNTAGANRASMGSTNSPHFTTSHQMFLRFTDDNFYGIIDSNTAFAQILNTNTTGYYVVSRTSNNSIKAYKNSSLVATNTTTIIPILNSYQILISARNDASTPENYDNKEAAFASIGDGLTDTEAANFYTVVQKYQTSLSRQIGTPVLAEGQTAGLLETYSGAAAAYSLRKLRNGYVGNAIRVRRSSDNSEQNIAFDANGNLDTVSLLAFVGSGNGFVTTWYDQSGNGSNLIQTTSANQARIVYSGVLETLNGKPALVTNYNYSNSGYYKATYASTINGPATMFNIGSNVATPGSGYLWDGLNTSMYAYSYNNTWMRIGGSAEFALTGYSQGITTQRIINAIYNGSSSKLRINNGTYATGNTGTISATGLTLGGAYNGSYLAPAYNQEHIVYSTNQESNATGINTNINLYYSIY